MKRKSTRPSPYLAVDLAHVDLRRDGRFVLRDVRWRIRPGQRWLLQGDNGAGKTQLLKLIAGDVWPQPRPHTRRMYRSHGERSAEPMGFKEAIAYIGSERLDRYQHYDWNYRVTAIVGTGIERSDIPLRTLTAVERLRIARQLRQLGIAHLARRRFLTLSQGERRLVLLARALVGRPELLLLDEPLNGLDAHNSGRVLMALNRLRRSKLPWIYATHRLAEMPAGMTHRARLQRGRLRTERWRRAPRAGAKKRPVAPVAGQARGPATVPVPLIELRHASVWREGAVVLRDLSLRIDAGDCWIVHGGNGSGKSTFLGLLHGDHAVASPGVIWRRDHAEGTPLHRFQRHVGCVAPELQSALPRRSTVLAILVAGLRGAFGLDGAPTVSEARAAMRALRQFGAQDHARRRLGELSYGQTRRVLFARALARGPDILLLDEPYTGLDAVTRGRLSARIEACKNKGITIVIASHHRDEWPRWATHELELADGGVRYRGVRR